MHYFYQHCATNQIGAHKIHIFKKGKKNVNCAQKNRQSTAGNNNNNASNSGGKECKN